MNKITCKLNGLDCAHCAAKIQENICKLDGVKKADLIFTTQDLSVEVTEEGRKEHYLRAIAKIVQDFEPDVRVTLQQPDGHEVEDTRAHGMKNDLLLFISGGFFFLLGLLLPLPFWPKLGVFAAGYLLAGGKVVYNAAKNISRGQVFDENFLMSIATLGAFALQEFSEAVAVMLFYKAGQMLEGVAVNRSRKSIRSLLDIKPQSANLKTPEGIKTVRPAEVKPGDLVLIKPGERVPLDGIVVEGNSFADTSALTGESVPRTVGAGDPVLSGFINTSGSLIVEITKDFQDSTLSRILDLVQNAASKKAPAESFITKFARYYTPAVVAAALLLAVVPPLVLGSGFSHWLYKALAFLVVSCPCALVISIPLSYFGGIGGASRRGILIKGGNYLDALNQANTIIFDKTGTLTKGIFKVTQTVPAKGFTEEELLSLAALAECHSSHPIAKSVLEAYRSLPPETGALSTEEIPGCGVKAFLNGKEILAGNDRLLHLDSNIDHDTCHVQGTVVHVAVDKAYAGYLLISDQVKDDAVQTITELKKLPSMRVAMLTGDSEDSAKNVCGILGIEECYYGLLPQEKAEKLEMMKVKNLDSKLVFVGDGINDAPVLAMSDIGIAMGGLGSDAAIEAADIVLMTDEPSKLLEAMKIARKTQSVVWQNILFALGVKALVMIFVAGGISSMWEAVFADVGVTLIAVFNSLRVLRA